MELILKAQVFSHPSYPAPAVQVFPIHEIAPERFYDCICIPLGPVLILEEVFYAGPARLAIKFTMIALIKKFTMLQAHVLLIFLAIFDLHFPILPVYPRDGPMTRSIETP